MFGSSHLRVLAAAAAAGCFFWSGSGFAQVQTDPAPVANAANQGDIDPLLRQLLEAWSRNSQQINKLQGQHKRRVYDLTFEVEKVSVGRFYYEAPDKGRIDVEPAPIANSEVEARAKGEIPCRRGKDGKPYELRPDQSERWICDGEKIFDIDDDRKEAVVAQLPPQLQGTNIMNSPLPFLFGLPPDEAVKRFELSFSPNPNTGTPQVFKRGDKFAHIRAEPKLRQDQANWSKADIILDVSTFLPAFVRMVNPAETEETVYAFHDMKKNGFNFIKFWDDPFKPDLRDHNVQVMQPGQDQDPAQRNAPPQVAKVPDMTGMLYTDAAGQLQQLGVQQADIKYFKGGPAQNAADINRIRNQKPEPGTPLQPDTKISLQIWEKPSLQ